MAKKAAAAEAAASTEAAPKKPRPPRKIRPDIVKLDDKGLPPLHRRQLFTPTRVARWDIKEAAYNPRVMDPLARAKLEQEIRRGLVNAIVWNQRTGNLVGGHQRLKVLDMEAGEHEACKGKGCTACHDLGVEPYSLDVDAIDATEWEEKRLNAVLNNPALQGQYDPEKLQQMLLSMHEEAPERDLVSFTGFEQMDLITIGLDEEITGLFDEPEAALDAAQQLDEVAALAEERKEEIKQIKALKKKHRAEHTSNAVDDQLAYIAIVFHGKQRVQNAALVRKRLSMGEQDIEVDGGRLMLILRIDPVEDEAEAAVQSSPAP